MFRLKQGSFVIPSDGAAFDKAWKNSAWANYAGVGMALTSVNTLVGDPDLNPAKTNDLTILHRHKSGLYYQEIFVGNQIGYVGQFISIVGIAGNNVVGCQYPNVTEPPSPLVPKGGDNLGICNGPFLADLNTATCSYTQGDGKLAYDIVQRLILNDPIFSSNVSGRTWVEFSDTNVFAEKDPNGNKWPQWVLNNRDEFYDEGKTSPPCSEFFEKSATDGALIEQKKTSKKSKK